MIFYNLYQTKPGDTVPSYGIKKAIGNNDPSSTITPPITTSSDSSADVPMDVSTSSVPVSAVETAASEWKPKEYLVSLYFIFISFFYFLSIMVYNWSVVSMWLEMVHETA